MDLVGELFPFIFNKINENCQKELEAIRKQYPFQPLKVTMQYKQVLLGNCFFFFGILLHSDDLR